MPIIPFGDVSQAIPGDSKRTGTEARYAAFFNARERESRLTAWVLFRVELDSPPMAWLGQCKMVQSHS